MAISKSLFLIFLVICWLGIGGYSQAIGGGEPLPCIQKLLPCEKYLMMGSPASASSPAPACCVPLKQMVASDTQCLCAVFNNQAILKSLNVTQDEALNLAKTCGANADISICSKETAPSGSPSIPAAPSTNSSETNAPPKNNAGTTTTIRAVYFLLSVTILMSFIVSLF